LITKYAFFVAVSTKNKQY